MPGAAQSGLLPAVFNRDVLSFDVAHFFQPVQKRGHKRRGRTWYGTAKKASHRHRLLLCVQGARRGHHTTQQEQELAASHSMTSSARARIDGGIVIPSTAAVFMFITSSNSVGCSTGISTGFAPRRTLTPWRASWRYTLVKRGP